MSKIVEGFEVNDLNGVLEPKIHIDEFVSKIGKDSDIMVLSFLLADRTAALDLVNFLEIGYGFILDADISASEIKPGSYLVFVEILRRGRAISQIFQIIDNLRASSGLNRKDWHFSYINNKQYHELTAENLKKYVPLSPRAYRKSVVEPIQEIQKLSGLSIQESFACDNDIEQLMRAAGINPDSRN